MERCHKGLIWEWACHYDHLKQHNIDIIMTGQMDFTKVHPVGRDRLAIVLIAEHHTLFG